MGSPFLLPIYNGKKEFNNESIKQIQTVHYVVGKKEILYKFI